MNSPPHSHEEFDEIASWFAAHPPSCPEIVNAHGLVRLKYTQFARDMAELLPGSRERSRCLEALDSSAMYANAALARRQMIGPALKEMREALEDPDALRRIELKHREALHARIIRALGDPPLPDLGDE